MQAAPLSSEARATSWRVFALVLFSASYFFQSSGHNEAARFDQIRSVSERGEWWIDQIEQNSGDVIRVAGHVYPNKAPGTTFLGIPLWVASRGVFSLLPIDDTKQVILVTYAITVALAALPTALISLMLFRILARTGSTSIESLLISLGYGLGTIAFPFATVFFGHQLAAFFAFAPFYLVWRAQWIEVGWPRVRGLAIAGLLIGFLPVIEYPGAIASGLIGIYALLTLRGAASPLLIGSLVGILPLPLYNEIAFGSVTSLGYGFYTKDSLFPAHTVGLMGVSWPRIEVLQQITFRAKRGLFYANPWLAFGLLAPFFIRKSLVLRREFLLALSIVVAFLIFNSGFGDSIIYWGGAFSFGPRHLLTALPFGALLISLPLARPALKPTIAFLIALTVLLMLPAVAIDPRLPYEPADPYWGFYFPLYLRSLYSVYPWSTFLSAGFFESSGAFNLGRMIGLPHALEILPLTLVWALAAWSFFKSEGRAARISAQGFAGLAILIGIWPAVGSAAPGRNLEPGLCRVISPNARWDYFSDYALQPEPASALRRRRVSSPTITAGEQQDAFDSGDLSSVAVTFSGYFEPQKEGWHVFRLEALGHAALYIDGLQELKVDKDTGEWHSDGAQIFLSRRPHEFIVRYMSDQRERRLDVRAALRADMLTPLRLGFTSGSCQ